MEHSDHVKLISAGVPKGGIWADLGSGRGAFTLALADCLGAENSQIYSLDLDRRALDAQRVRMEVEFPKNEVTYKQADFTRKQDLPPLDGILMANSLHFIQDKVPVLKQILEMLKPEGRLIMVEYDTDEGNAYVPYPLSFKRWQDLADSVGFSKTELLANRPSSFLGQFFSSLSYR